MIRRRDGTGAAADRGRDFLPALRAVDRELSAPIPDRVRILRELEGDLEDLRAQLVARGVPPAHARDRALELLMPAGPTLHELDAVHEPVSRRLARHLGEARVRLLERSALALAAAGVLGVEVLLLVRGGAFGLTPHLLGPVLIGGALLAGAVVLHLVRLARGSGRPGSIGGAHLLWLAGLVIAVGFGAALVDAWRVAAVLELSPELAGSLVPRWLFRTSAVLSVSLVTALLGGLVWFLTTQWFAAVSAAHRDVLGLGNPETPKGGKHHG